VQVWGLDEFGRQDLYAYGSQFIPSTFHPQGHQLELRTWAPRGSFYERMMGYFLGAKPRIFVTNTTISTNVDSFHAAKKNENQSSPSKSKNEEYKYEDDPNHDDNSFYNSNTQQFENEESREVKNPLLGSRDSDAKEDEIEDSFTYPLHPTNPVLTQRTKNNQLNKVLASPSYGLNVVTKGIVHMHLHVVTSGFTDSSIYLQ